MDENIIKLLKECKEALINRDAVKCYDSGHDICECTLCKIDRAVHDCKNFAIKGKMLVCKECGKEHKSISV